MSLGCGSCNLCCVLLSVPDINKPAHMRCWHTGPHGGCARQSEKTTSDDLKACAQFQCLWLASQSHPDMTKQKPRYMRPDQTHVVIGPADPKDDTLMFVQVDPKHPSAWQHPLVYNDLEGMLQRGMKIEIILGEQHFRLDGEVAVNSTLPNTSNV